MSKSAFHSYLEKLKETNIEEIISNSDGYGRIEVEEGTYAMSLNRAYLFSTKNGALMVSREHAITEGQYQGVMIQDSICIVKNDGGPNDVGIRQLNTFIETFGETFSDWVVLEDILDAISTKTSTYSAEVSYQESSGDRPIKYPRVNIDSESIQIRSTGKKRQPKAARKEDEKIEIPAKKEPVKKGRKPKQKKEKSLKEQMVDFLASQENTEYAPDDDLEKLTEIISCWQYYESSLTDEQKELLETIGCKDCILVGE